MKDWKKEIELKFENIEVIRGLENKKIKLRCKKDGNIWEARPYDINRGIGCAECSGNKKYTTETFIKKIEQLGQEVLVIGEYKNNNTKIEIKCIKCGDISFKKPALLLINKGCLQCYKNEFGKRQITSQDKFKNQIKIKFNDEYELLNEYKGGKINVTLKHKKCGTIFENTGAKMLYKKRYTPCPKCKIYSYGEFTIENFLRSNDIAYEKEKKFEDLKLKGNLRYDFYLPNLKSCIEYDGEQHFKIIKFFGGEERYNYTKKSDELKNKYCEENGIKLLRIPYYEKDIEGTIKKFIEKVSV